MNVVGSSECLLTTAVLASSGDYSATSFAIHALIFTTEISFKTDEDLLRKSAISHKHRPINYKFSL